MSESLQIKKWVPSPSEIFLDSMPLSTCPPEEKDGKYLCAISFTVKEIMKLPRHQQIEVFLKVLETIEMVAKMQKVDFNVVHVLRFNHETGHQMICFYAYFPQKFPFPR